MVSDAISSPRGAAAGVRAKGRLDKSLMRQNDVAAATRRLLGVAAPATM